jgi:integrase
MFNTLSFSCCLIKKISILGAFVKVCISALTGMSRGELLNLRWSHVDLSRCVIQIQSNATFRTKRGKQRAIPMSDVAFNLMSAKAGRVTGEYVFTRNRRKINDEHATNKLKKYVVDAKLPKGLERGFVVRG